MENNFKEELDHVGDLKGGEEDRRTGQNRICHDVV